MRHHLLIFAVCGGIACAHELGTTRVTIGWEESTRAYTVEIGTDSAALAEKLQLASGRPAGTPLAQLESTFRRRVKLAFDGQPVEPESIRFTIEPDQGASIRLAGTVPEGARQVTWTYGWTFASYALTLRDGASGKTSTVWLQGGDSSAPIDLASIRVPESRLAMAGRYVALGFTHIFPHGLDHMLFVLGLYLLCGRARPVLWQVSAFTVAHSITLGLSMYGLVSVPARIVEPLIALSIAYVAIENLFLSELRSWRVALVFAFGLLHGLGFAGALSELGLPRADFATALVAFNVGVEAGQLTVIAVAFLAVGWRWGSRAWYRERVVVPASLAIACLAVYWTIERLSS